VPNGDFVTWLRAMLAEPEANDYFSDLGLQSGRVVKHSLNGIVPLESDDSTAPLMNYLNPTLTAIEDDEVVAAAKFIHWTMNHPNTQTLQVKQMVATGHAMLVHADRRLGLDNVAGDLCCIVMDILHQGRGGSGTFPDMLKALKTSDPYKALLAIGADNEPGRVKTLKKELDARRAAFAAKHWNSAQKEFV